MDQFHLQLVEPELVEQEVLENLLPQRQLVSTSNIPSKTHLAAPAAITAAVQDYPVSVGGGGAGAPSDVIQLVQALLE